MTRRLQDNPLLEARVRLDSLPSEGRDLTVTATPDQRERIAARMGVSAVDHLEARLKARGFRGGIRVTGELKAEVTQPCVVTFEPVREKIAEKVDRIFLPGAPQAPDVPAGAEVYVDLDGEDEPDYFDGPEVDLTELLLELLALAIDPYPRKPGAKIEQGEDDGTPDSASPFAALAQRKSTRD